MRISSLGPRVSLGILAVIAAAVPAAAAGKAPPVFGTGVEIVKLTVTVRDSAGQVVSDLAAEDFTIYDEGKRQPIDLFVRAGDSGSEGGNADSLALDAGVLFDTSASMQKQLRLSQSAAVRFIESIRARDLLMIFFDVDIRVSRYDGEEQQGIFERILDATTSGYTALHDAIVVYLQRVEAGSGRKVLLLFTDGIDYNPQGKITRQRVMEAVRGSDVVMYPIGFAGELPPGHSLALAGRGFLRELADVTGGDVFYPGSYKDLPKIYDRILEDLGSQYVLGFVPPPGGAAESFRKIKVEVRRKGLKVRHRSGYISTVRARASAADMPR